MPGGHGGTAERSGGVARVGHAAGGDGDELQRSQRGAGREGPDGRAGGTGGVLRHDLPVVRCVDAHDPRGEAGPSRVCDQGWRRRGAEVDVVGSRTEGSAPSQNGRRQDTGRPICRGSQNRRLGRREDKGQVSGESPWRAAPRDRDLVRHLGRRVRRDVQRHADCRVTRTGAESVASGAGTVRAVPARARHGHQRQAKGDQLLHRDGAGSWTGPGGIAHHHRKGYPRLPRREISRVRAGDAQQRLGSPGYQQPDHVVPGVGDVDVAGGVHRHARRTVELSAGGRAPIARIARRAGPGHRRGGAAGVHTGHDVGPSPDARLDCGVRDNEGVVAVRDVETAGGIHRRGLRVSGSRDGGDGAIQGHLADRIVVHEPGAGEGAAIDRVGAIIPNVEVAGGIHRHADREELGAGGRASVAGVAKAAVAGHRRNGSIRRQLANREAVDIVKVAVCIHRHAAAAGCVHRRDRAVSSRHLAHSSIGNVEVAAGIQRHCGGPVELSAGRRASVARRACNAIAGHRRDHPIRSHLADSVVARIRDVEVAGCIDRQPAWGVELGARSRTSVAQPGGAVAGHRRDGAVGPNLAHPVVCDVGNVEVAGCVHRHTPWPELCAGGRASIA